MSEFSEKAQPYLDALARAIFARQEVRDWLVAGTKAQNDYTGAASLHERQRARRSATKQPFFCNYWCGRCDQGRGCETAPKGERRIETDLMAFLRNDRGRVLALHLEFKHPRECLLPRQARMYAMRASCWASGRYRPGSVLEHLDWLTVIVCDPDFHPDAELAHFDRVISHAEATLMIGEWP